MLIFYSCAAINGIDPAIVSRANEITSLLARGENILAACAVLSPGEMEDLEDAVDTSNITRSRAKLTQLQCRISWQEVFWRLISLQVLQPIPPRQSSKACSSKRGNGTKRIRGPVLFPISHF